MVRFSPSTSEDADRIQKWADADPYHRGQKNPGWWLTGNGLLSFRLDDSRGPLVYVKITEDDKQCRIHCQFAPVEEVSKRRLALGMLRAFPVVMDYLEKQDVREVIFNTISDSLGLFFTSQGFIPEENCDYVLRFEKDK